MNHKLAILLALPLILTACSSGGGSSAPAPTTGGNNNGGNTQTLSYSATTLTASTVYAKNGEQVTLTLTPKDTNSATMDLAGKYDPQIQIFCTGCTAQNAAVTINVGQMTELTDVYTATFTPDGDSIVYASVIFMGANYGNGNVGSVPNANDPTSYKVKLEAWDECYTALAGDIQSPTVWRTRVVSGITYNLICDEYDVVRTYTNGSNQRFVEMLSGQDYVFDTPAGSGMAAAHVTTMDNSKNQGFILMRNIPDFSAKIVVVITNNFLNSANNGELFVNGKTYPAWMVGNMNTSLIKAGMPQ